MNKQIMDASSRIALAALLHDLGKMAERGRIPTSKETLDNNKHLYCPFHKDGGWFSHVHAAYSAIGIDLVEEWLPSLKKENAYPFGGWSDEGAGGLDDSLINGAAKHHRPDTALQWVIAAADRLASGFEREEFAKYNSAAEKPETGRNHYQARQLSLFEQINVESASSDPAVGDLKYRYKLEPMSANTIFPVPASDYEPSDDKTAQAEYLALWGAFVEGLKKIPESHKNSLPLWLDHFDSLYLNFCHSIPSATAFGTRPDVSLYDHSKAVAALAVALWRYYDDKGTSGDDIVDNLKTGKDREDHKFLLIQGDFTGIQDFIFSSGAETNKRAAKTLRGRSLYVSLLAECGAIKVLEGLSLPSTSQIVNAAGKFLIVAPNTPDTLSAVETLQSEFDDWFLEHTYGVSGLVLAATPASSRDFMKGGDQATPPFAKLMERLFINLEERKLSRFNLCDDDASQSVRSDFLRNLDSTKGLCALNSRYPASREMDDGIYVSDLSHDQVKLGEYVVRTDHLIVSTKAIGKQSTSVPIFGYTLNFMDRTLASKNDLNVEDGDIVRAYDFSLPVDAETPLWNGFSRRHVSAYVPRFDTTDESMSDRYDDLSDTDGSSAKAGDLKTFSHLACEDRYLDDKDKWLGINALSVVKGDIDDLGLIFQRGLTKPTFAKMAGLSRQLNAFFTIHLPQFCAEHHPNTYTVFAGGDDFLLVGPWKSQMRLLQDMRENFAKYTVNPAIHFSAGISTVKPGLPIQSMARSAEAALEASKSHAPTKNAVTCYGKTVEWTHWNELVGLTARMESLQREYGLSTGYLYGMIGLVELAAKVDENPENAIWLSRFVYRSKRFVDDNMRGMDDAQKERAVSDLMTLAEAIKKHRGAFNIPLFNHLYTYR